MSWKRWIAGFDAHGDKQDRAAVGKFLEFCKEWKPSIRINGGDNWDFRPLRGKANADERRESMLKDYNRGTEFLKAYKPTVFIRGNHDERLWKLREADHGPETDFAIGVIGEINGLMKKLGCKMLPYHFKKGVFRIGKLKAIHGFFCGANAPHKTAAIYGDVIYGHDHSIASSAAARWEGTEGGHSCGCLCKLDMGYHESKPGTLRWEHGFVYGVVNDRTGDFHYWQARKCGGKWMLPSDMVEI
jgi:hypothetical protein